MKNILITCFVLLGTACAAAPDDVVEQDVREEQTAPTDGVPTDDGVEVEVEASGVTPQASGCRWATVDCCNYGRSAVRVYQCWGAGGWRNVAGTRRCATELGCAL